MSDKSEPNGENEVEVKPQVQEVSEKSPTLEADESPILNEDPVITQVSMKPWYVRYSPAIQAFAAIGSLLVTAVLAYFTYGSLNEIQKQRQIAHKQFVLDNSPSVRVGPLEKGTLRGEADSISLFWGVENKGGYITDVTLFTKLLFYDATYQEGAQPNYKIIAQNNIEREIEIARLERDEKRQVKNIFYKSPTSSWLGDEKEYSVLEAALSHGATPIFLYLKVEYMVPEELTLNAIARVESVYNIYRWVRQSDRFEQTNKKEYGLVLKDLKELGLLNREHSNG